MTIDLKRLKDEERERQFTLPDEELWLEVETALSIYWFKPKFEKRVIELMQNKPAKLTKVQRNMLASFLIVTEDQRDRHIYQLEDAQLKNAARRILKTSYANARFAVLAFSIIKTNPETLTEKQRNALVGVLSVKWEAVMDKAYILNQA